MLHNGTLNIQNTWCVTCVVTPSMTMSYFLLKVVNFQSDKTLLRTIIWETESDTYGHFV